MKKSVKNIVIGLVGQFLIMLFGIVIPGIVLAKYGDETNGLINAIGQLFTYLALIEAGVGQSALQSLYKPIAENNREEISGIIIATQAMFKKMTLVYLLVVLLFATIYPLVVKIDNPASISIFGSTYLAVATLVMCQGFSNAVGFYYTSTFKQLLMADGCNYIIINITTIVRTSTSILRILLMMLSINIVYIHFVYCLLAILETVTYKTIIRIKYPWLDKHAAPSMRAMKQRYSFIVHEISNVIFNSTDIFILSIFCNLTVASIYSIYNLLFVSLSTLISQVSYGTFYILGQAYAKDNEDYNTIHDTYDTYYIAFVFAIFSTGYFLCLDFIRLYTSKVSDVDYIDVKLPILFVMIHLLSNCRITNQNLIKISGHVKQTIWRSLLQSTINLTASLILVNICGIYGVLLGTILSLLYRTNDIILYSNWRILKRSCWYSYKIVLLNFLLFAIILLTRTLIGNLQIASYLSLLIASIIVFAAVIVLYFGMNTLCNPTARNTMLHYLALRHGSAA